MHEAGRIRTVEARASDYVGRGALTMWTVLALPRILAGKTAFPPADRDAPHTWTSTVDVAELLVTVAAKDQAWGRAWHVPSHEPRSMRQLSRDAAEVAGVRSPRLVRMPYPVLWTAGLFDPTVRELRETQYKFARPFVMDSSAAQGTLGLRPASYAESLRQTIAGLRALPRFRRRHANHQDRLAPRAVLL